MVMDRGLHIRPRGEDARMQHAFEIWPQPLGVYRHAFEREFQQVVAADQFRRAGAGDEEPVGALGVTNGDMAEIVQHSLMSQDAVRDHQIAEQPVEILRHTGAPGPAGRRARGALNILRFMDIP
ncbi:hypothetical protein HMPREF9946_01820 [Acetobacteraceae bacterium AT-5844]|nr:hypothetical protein HMPREF9946_01820 [Acetobacteraceae bacterium AT-5844]